MSATFRRGECSDASEPLADVLRLNSEVSSANAQPRIKLQILGCIAVSDPCTRSGYLQARWISIFFWRCFEDGASLSRNMAAFTKLIFIFLTLSALSDSMAAQTTENPKLEAPETGIAEAV